jgi:hypothetical protein
VVVRLHLEGTQSRGTNGVLSDLVRSVDSGKLEKAVSVNLYRESKSYGIA